MATLNLLLRPERLMIDQVQASKDVWMLVDRLLKASCLSGEALDVLKVVWRRMNAGYLDENFSSAVTLLQRCNSVFESHVQELFLEEIKLHASLPFDDGNCSVSNPRLFYKFVSISNELFLRFMTLSSKLFRSFDCDPNFLLCWRHAIQTILNLSPNPSSLFPLPFQGLVMTLMAMKAVNLNTTLLDQLLAQSRHLLECHQSRSMLFQILLLFPVEFKALLHHSLTCQSDFHVHVVPSWATINQLF